MLKLIRFLFYVEVLLMGCIVAPKSSCGDHIVSLPFNPSWVVKNSQFAFGVPRASLLMKGKPSLATGKSHSQKAVEGPG